MKNQKSSHFVDFLEMDASSQRCIDKIKIVTLVHNTGRIGIITKKGKEHSVTLANLISELKADQHNEIVRYQYTLFENKLTFKYPEKRSTEFEKIVQKARLRILETTRLSGSILHDDCFEVTVQIDNVNLDLVEFIQ
jgi:hypothetical protein